MDHTTYRYSDAIESIVKDGEKTMKINQDQCAPSILKFSNSQIVVESTVVKEGVGLPPDVVVDFIANPDRGEPISQDRA